MTQRQELIVVAHTQSMKLNIQRAFKTTSTREHIRDQHSEWKID